MALSSSTVDNEITDSDVIINVNSVYPVSVFSVGRSGDGGGLDCVVKACLTAVLYLIAELEELQTAEPPTQLPLYTEKHIRTYGIKMWYSILLISICRSHPNDGFAQT